MAEKEFEMIALINSSKTLDFEQPAGISKHTLPEFLGDCEFLVASLRKLSVSDFSKLMKIFNPLVWMAIDLLQCFLRRRNGSSRVAIYDEEMMQIHG